MAAEEAWLDAGLERAKPESNHVNWESGIILGTGFGGADVVGNSIVPQVNAGTLKI